MSMDVSIQESNSMFFPEKYNDKYESFLFKTETTLNKYSYYPIVSSFTGAGRAVFGCIELISRVSKIIFNNMSEYQVKDFSPSREYGYIVHSLANIFRAKIEMVPLFGNITMLFYDKVLGMRFSYDIEGKF